MNSACSRGGERAVLGPLLGRGQSKTRTKPPPCGNSFNRNLGLASALRRRTRVSTHCTPDRPLATDILSAAKEGVVDMRS
jgi:hypothetical protein